MAYGYPPRKPRQLQPGVLGWLYLSFRDSAVHRDRGGSEVAAGVGVSGAFVLDTAFQIADGFGVF